MTARRFGGHFDVVGRRRRSAYVTVQIFQNAAISVVVPSAGLYVAPRTDSASGTETGAPAPRSGHVIGGDVTKTYPMHVTTL